MKQYDFHFECDYGIEAGSQSFFDSIPFPSSASDDIDIRRQFFIVFVKYLYTCYICPNIHLSEFLSVRISRHM